MQRKDFFKDGLKEITKEILKTPIGSYIDERLQSFIKALEPFAIHHSESQKEKTNIFFVRPPGSNPDPKAFNELCTACNDCIIACPHYAIFKFNGIHGPIMNPNYKACHICDDYPCIAACETKALMPLKEDTLPYFGYAQIEQEKCLNFELINTKKRKLNCSICYDVCPVEDAIELKNKVPTVLENCIGCGICKHQCPESAIKIIIE
jgi:ferredoxin-type protein NapG